MTRELLNVGILLSRQVALTFLVLGLLLYLWCRIRPLSSLPSTLFRKFIALGGWVLFGLFAGVGLWYVLRRGFAGEVEPLVASLSWLWREGLPLYHNLDAACQYSVLYGPSVFLTNGLFLHVLGPTLVSAKLASFLGACGALLFIYGALAQKKHNLVAQCGLLLGVLLFWSHGFSIYLVRPDALLVFSTAMGVYLAARSRPLTGALGLAALLGFAVNLKVHGAFYFIPIFYLSWTRWGWKWLMVSLLGSIPLIFAPFMLFPAISLPNYIIWLKEATHHGLITADLLLTLRDAFLLLLPWVAVTVASGHPLRALSRNQGALTASLMALAPILVIAAKPGAGPVHLLPLVPVILVMAGLAWQEDPREHPLALANLAPVWQATLLAAGMTVFLAGSVTEYRSTARVAWELANATNLATEVQGIMNQYPGVKMAMACGGEKASFRETWYRPLLAFADQPLMIDPISVMDRCRAGRPLSAGIYSALKSGIIQMWLVPKGQVPFAKANWYPPHQEIFPAKFRETFKASYAMRGHTEHFDLWFWQANHGSWRKPIVVQAGGENSSVMAPSN